MVEWKTIKTEIIDISTNDFLEINFKKSPDGLKYLGLAKGWKNPENQKRYRSNILVPFKDVDELIQKIELIKKMAK